MDQEWAESVQIAALKAGRRRRLLRPRLASHSHVPLQSETLILPAFTLCHQGPATLRATPKGLHLSPRSTAAFGEGVVAQTLPATPESDPALWVESLAQLAVTLEAAPAEAALLHGPLPATTLAWLEAIWPQRRLQPLALGEETGLDRHYSAEIGGFTDGEIAPEALEALRKCLHLRRPAKGGSQRLLLWSAVVDSTLRNSTELRASLSTCDVLDLDRLTPSEILAALKSAQEIVVPDLTMAWLLLAASSGAKVFAILPAGEAPRPWQILAEAAGLHLTLVQGSSRYRRLRHRIGRRASPPVFHVDPGLLLPFLAGTLPKAAQPSERARLFGRGGAGAALEGAAPEFATTLSLAALPLETLLDRLYAASAEADVLTGAWAIASAPTPKGFETRLRALRRAAVRALEGATPDEVKRLARHPFFTDPGRALRSGFAVLGGLSPEELSLAQTLRAPSQGAGIGPPLHGVDGAGLDKTERARPKAPVLKRAAPPPFSEVEAWRRLLLSMLLLPNWRCPLPQVEALAAASPEFIEQSLLWATAPAALIHPGEDQLWAAHAEAVLDWLADLLEGDLTPLTRARLTRMAGRIDLGQLLLIDVPLGGVRRARNRLLAIVAEGGEMPLSAVPLSRLTRLSERMAFYQERLRLLRARHKGEGIRLWIFVGYKALKAVQSRFLALKARLRFISRPSSSAGAEGTGGSQAAALPLASVDRPAPPISGGVSLPHLAASGDAASLPQGKPKRRLRVGLLCRTFEKGPDSEAVVTFLQSFDKDEFELFAYSVGFRDRVVSRDPTFDRIFDALIPNRRELPADPAGVRAMLLADQLDIFLYANATTYGVQLLDLALYHRVAPVQAVLNSHVPMPMGYPSFDAVITGLSDDPSQDLPQDDFAEELIRLPGPVINYLTTLEPKPNPPLDRAALGLAESDVVMMNAGSSMKLRYETLRVMMEAVRDVPNGVLLLAPYNPGWAARSMAFVFNRQLSETAAEVGLDPSRIKVLGELSVAEAEAALSCADVYLNPFPHGGATMTHLALIHGVPPVTLRRRSTRSIDQFLVETHGFGELLADTPEAYRDLARQLGTDAAWRADLKARLAQAATTPGFVNNPDYAQVMCQAIKDLWARYGEAGGSRL